ncbi:hypothetical protein J5J83_08835 [Azoarcus sp. L1K30]|uniref:FimV/HubP family polar landmark protein n=1 Tax=Azoarcus sp. L1K30 TaxID=2820277 RepID=UPI001B82E5E0|nr:FimV/HubP family polar landmark protein [Azoarcus sp. L1K30]MBR0566219.1 hypothetical protein [Azoarcus sp. L1K30]
MKTSIKASLIAAAIASFPLGGHAAGLGQINVFSALGQPLRAEIQISATAQELSSISARVASADAFRQANIPYPGFLSSIRVSVERSGQRQVVKLSSDRPINEPFVGLLIELDWATGRLSREYTFLLDPVDVAAPKPVAALIAEQAAAPRPKPSAAPVVARTPQADRYTVRRGDTLRRIADENLPVGANLDQMLIALFRANPSAFEGENINRLRAGAILSMPSEAAVMANSPAEARREVLAQAADFEAYRQRLAGTAVTREEPAVPAEQSSSGRIVPKVEDARAPADGGDKLQISRSQDAPGMDKAAVTRLQALEEELVAREKGLEEANARLAQLEQSIRELQKLLELKSQSLAQLQPAGEAPAAAAPPPASQAAPAAPAAPETAPASAPAPVAESAPAAPSESAQKSAEAPPKPAPAPPPAMPVEEPDFIQSLIADPAVLAAGGGALALLLGFVAYRSRQRKNAIQALDSAALMSEFPPDSSAVFGGTGGQSVDTGNSSILQTDFSQSGLSSIDADEGVDPVAEADVYMAYGRDAQAEEILEDALKADPARTAIYLKLLEIYAQRQSVKQFETTASELYSRTGGQGTDWEKAAQMGRRLDPNNPLYAAQSVDSDRTVPPATELPGASKADLTVPAVAAAAATAVAADEAATTKDAADDVGQVLSSLDFTTSSPIEPSPSQLKDTWTMPGDLGQIANGDADAVEAGAENEDVGEEINVESIDFDLGGDDAAQDTAEESLTTTDLDAGAPAAEDAPDSEMDLELDGDEFTLEMGGSDVVEPKASPTKEDVVSGTATVVGDDLGQATADEPALEFDLPELDAPADDKKVAFDMSATVIEPVGGGADEDDTVMDLEKTSFEPDLLDFDFELDAPTATPSAPAGLDLTSIDLDLEPPASEPDSADAAPEQAGSEPTSDETEGALNPEVETKLELARAYDEMGDKEGALELLNEVLAEGSSSQQAAARALIEKLG